MATLALIVGGGNFEVWAADSFASASYADPYSVSVSNLNFDDGNITGWTVVNFVYHTDNTRKFAEIYNKKNQVNSIKRTISDLKAGHYRLFFSGGARGNNVTGAVYAYIGTNQITINGEPYSSYSIDYDLSADGSVEIGLATTSTHTAEWVAFDDVELKYYGPTVNYKAARDLAILNAGSDLTSFIINNDFSSGVGNWPLSSGSCGNQQGSTGAMESWNNNNMSVSQTIALPNGNYRITVDMISGNEIKQAYLFASSGANEVHSDVVSVQSESGRNNYANMCEDVVGNTITIDNFPVTDGILTIGVKDPSNGGWIVFDNFTLTRLADSNGMNMTSSITNAAVTSVAGWTNGRINSNQQYTGAPDNTYMDTWSATTQSLDQNQSVTLPAGSYLLKCATRATENLGNDPNIYVYYGDANIGSAIIHREGSTGNYLGNGWGWTYVPFTLSETSTVKIGFSAKVNNTWAGADDFHLTYYTSELEMKKAHLAQIVAEANGWAEKLTTTMSLEAALSASAPTCTTVEECNTSISTLQTKIAQARATSDAYAAYQAMKANVAPIKAVATTTDATDKQATLDAAFSDETVEAATDAATIEAETAKILPAIKNYIKTLTPSGDPFDLTFMITNPSFDDSYNGWSYADAPNPGNDATQRAAHAMEYYQKNYDINQTLSSMPTGTYRLKVKAFQRPGASGTIVPAYVNAVDKADGTANVNAEIYVNGGVENSQLIKNAASPMITAKVNTGSESSVEVSGTTYWIPNDMVSAVAYFGEGYYENETEIVASATTVRFGFRCSSGTGTAYWTIFDDFRLYYAGPLDLSTFETQLAGALAAAKAVSGKMNSTVASNLTTAIEKYDGKSYETSDDYTTAIEELNEATEAARASITAYTHMKSELDKIADAVATTNVYTDESYATNYTSNLAAWTDETASTPTAETFTFGSRVTGSAPAILLSPWKVGETAALTDRSLYINTWSTEGNNDGTNFKTPFFEYFTDNTKNLGTKTFTATVPVENGNYQVSVWARVQQRTDSPKNDETSQRIRMTVNDGEAVSLAMGESVGNNFFLGTFKANGIVSDGNLVIKIIVDDGSNCHWLSFQNMNYQKATDITIAEDASAAPASGFANVTLARAFNAGWNAVVLPFDTPAFDSAEIAEFTGESGDAENVTLNFTKVDNFEANKPYLVYFPSAVAANKEFGGVTVAPSDVLAAGTNFDFRGTYVVKNVEADNWVISGGQLKKTIKETQLKPTRTYFAPKSAEARIARFVVDGEEVTAIKAVMAKEGAVVEGVYNLKGQKVNGDLKKGVYVVNGKKIVK